MAIHKRERRRRVPYVIYTATPNADSKTWANIQSKGVDIRLRKIETLRFFVVEMARRRLSRAKEPKPEALKGSGEMLARTSKKGEETKRTSQHKKLDEFFSSKQS
ncbi:MAG: hypothetical protein QXE01_07230 [Sulfolobales archaeon]